MGCGRCSARPCIATWRPSAWTSWLGEGTARWISRWACCPIAAIACGDGSGGSGGMKSIARSAALGISTVFGALMVGLAAVGSHGPAVVAGVAAGVVVGVGVAFRPAATIAVLLSVATIVASDPSLVFAAWSGLCAVAYLVCRHAVGVPAGVVMWSWPTAIAAVGFAC